MLVGSWGPLIFQFSGIEAFTFSEITQDSSGRWVSHEPINTAPISEFLGPGQDNVKVKIVLTRMLGVDPKITYEMIRQFVRKGMNFPLILKGAPLSGNMWYIDRISGVSETFAPGTGDILWMEMTCDFKEYK